MVKVFEREFDENQERLEERTTRLYDIARDMLGKDIMVINFTDTIMIEEGEMDVYPHLRAIALYTKKKFERAQKLAKVYEERFGEEFVIFDYTKRGTIDAIWITEIGICI